MANFEYQGYRLQRVCWIYVGNLYALLHTKYKNNWLHGFRTFVKNFPPIIRKLMTDPQGIAKLDPKGTVGTIYAGYNNIKYINYGLIEKIFKGFFP